MLEVPRIACGGRVQQREFGGGELAQDDRAGALKSRHRLGVVVGNEAGERLRATLGCKPGGIEDVLDSNRHAVERPAKAPLASFAVEFGGGAARPRAIYRDPRLDRAVEQIDPCKRRVDQLDGRDLVLADKTGRLRERERVRLCHRIFLNGRVASVRRVPSHFLPLRCVSKNAAILGHSSKAAFSR